jgi:Ras-related protein Rab-7A
LLFCIVFKYACFFRSQFVLVSFLPPLAPATSLSTYNSVGKTSLMNRYAKDRFSQKYKATIGADTMTKEVTIDEKLVTLQIWDTAGQERFQSLGVSFYRGADACVLVYDITDQKSFDNLQTWKEDFLTTAGPKNASNFPFVVLGNKCDLENRRNVQKGSAKSWCAGQEQPHIQLYETSAKDNVNVNQAFVSVVKLALAQSANQEAPPIPKAIKFNQPAQNNNSSGCC